LHYRLDCINTSVTTLSAFSACSGSASVAQSYTVAGSNLTANIVITAPTHFEVSVTSATAGFAGSQTLTQSGGNVAATTIYVRQTDVYGKAKLFWRLFRLFTNFSPFFTNAKMVCTSLFLRALLTAILFFPSATFR
jgi:hypothetical protein